MLDFAIAKNWLPKLVGALKAERKKRSSTLALIGDTFGDPLRLARHYIPSLCQQTNPATADQDIDVVVTSDAFETLKTFFARCNSVVPNDGRRQMFVLADAGMGKTSLLVMLRLGHLCSFWPKTYKCALLRLGNDTASEVAKLALLSWAQREAPSVSVEISYMMKIKIGATGAISLARKLGRLDAARGPAPEGWRS